MLEQGVPAPERPNLPVGETPTRVDVTRAEALLRAASVLLARGNVGNAVDALHAELRRELQQPKEGEAGANASRCELEDEHRRLATELSRQRARVRPHSRRDLLQRLPMWVAWVAVVAVVVGLMLRYTYAIFDRWRWSRQYPEGPWISRYYETSDFKKLQVVRYDVAIDYDWGKGSPAEAMDRDYWSATWDACLIVAVPVELALSLYADDRGKVIVDDALRIRVSASGTKSVRFTLAPGSHHFRVEYVERRRGAKLKLQGLDFAGTESYRFQRPRLEGDTPRCDASTP